MNDIVALAHLHILSEGKESARVIWIARNRNEAVLAEFVEIKEGYRLKIQAMLLDSICAVSFDH